MNSAYSNAAIQVLVAAGWQPDRRVSISHWVRDLASLGITVLPEAQQILESFGGMAVRPARTEMDAYWPGDIVFDPLSAAEPDRLAYWQQLLGMTVSPIAAIDGQTYLWIARDRHVFGCWDSILFKYGNTFEDALENTLLFAKRKPVEFARAE